MRLKLTSVLVICISTALSGSVWAKKNKRIDLNGGVVFPSTGLTVFENPAALPFGGGSLFELAALFDGEPDFRGSFSARPARGMGVALGIERLFGTTQLTPGVGVSVTKKISLGVGTTFIPGDPIPDTFNVGLRYAAKKGTTLTLVFHDALRFNSWTAGVGWGKAGKLMWEVDFTFVRSGDFDIDSLACSASLNVVPAKKVALLVRYYFDLIPQIQFSSRNLELGLSYWLSKSFALFGHYQNPRSRYLAGVRVAL